MVRSGHTLFRSDLIRALGDLTEPERREAAIRCVAGLLRVDTFVFFVHDPEVGKLLAAPGFPQTFPDRRAWQEFLAATCSRQIFKGVVPWRDSPRPIPAVGVQLGDRAAGVFLGGDPDQEAIEEACSLLRLIAIGFTCERTVAFAGVQLQLAQQATQESSALAKSLDEARRAAQAEVAARKEVEHALREARDELARTNVELERRVHERTVKLQETIREMEAFSYTVSHDLRAPLRAMYGYADVLLQDTGGKLTDEEHGYLRRITVAGRRLDRLIQDVLRYSRVSRAEITLRPIGLESVVQQVIDEHAILRAASTHIDVQSPLGDVLGHDLLLSQCISNLLLNAVKFVAPGIDPRVRLRSETRGGIVRLWIEDNGIGIEAEHMGRLFGMFERIHPANAFEGNGIGLAIVQRAVHRLGGDVGVESTPGAGSRFWLDLQAN